MASQIGVVVVRRIVLHDSLAALLVAGAEDARRPADRHRPGSAAPSAPPLPLSVRNSWPAYRAGRTSGVKVCIVQMPCRSGWPSGVRGTTHSALVRRRRHAAREVRRRRRCCRCPCRPRPADTGRAAACDRPCRSVACDATIWSGAFPCSTHCSSAVTMSKCSVLRRRRSAPCPAP